MFQTKQAPQFLSSVVGQICQNNPSLNNLRWKTTANETPGTRFRDLYEMRKVPIILKRQGLRQQIDWLIDIKRLDTEYYLPLFFGGLGETVFPYSVLAHHGCLELLNANRGKNISCLSSVCQSIRKAFKTEHPVAVINTCEALQSLAMLNRNVGTDLVNHYKTILLPLNRLFERVNPHQRRYDKVCAVILQTLRILIMTADPESSKHVKLFIPSYDPSTVPVFSHISR